MVLGVRQIFEDLEFELLLDEVWEQIHEYNDEFFGINWLDVGILPPGVRGAIPSCLLDVYYI